MWCHVLLPVLPSPRPRCCCCLFFRRQPFLLFNTVVLLPSACLLLSFSSFIIKITSTIHCTWLNTFRLIFISCSLIYFHSPTFRRLATLGFLQRIRLSLPRSAVYLGDSRFLSSIFQFRFFNLVLKEGTGASWQYRNPGCLAIFLL